MVRAKKRAQTDYFPKLLNTVSQTQCSTGVKAVFYCKGVKAIMYLYIPTTYRYI